MGKATRLAERRARLERYRAARSASMDNARCYEPGNEWRAQWVRVAREMHARLMARLRAT